MKISFLIHGIEGEGFKSLLEKLQKQIDLIHVNECKHIDIVYYADQGESSEDERKQWLLEQCVSDKYVFVDKKTELKDNFILLRYNAVKQGRPTEKQIELEIYTK